MRRAEQPVTIVTQKSGRFFAEIYKRTHIPKPTRYCNVVAFEAWIFVLRLAISCSILVSTSLILSSCLLLSSRIRPFSRLRSRRTPAWVRVISSRRRRLSRSTSVVRRSFSVLSMDRSFLAMSWSSDLDWAKSTC
jgi:hypothetical protein